MSSEVVLREFVSLPTEKSFFEGPAVHDGVIFFTNLFQAQILSLPLMAKDAKPKLELQLSNPCNGLGFHSGKLFACEIGTTEEASRHALLAVDLNKKTVTCLAKSFAGNTFHSPNDLVIGNGGIYFTDPKIPIPRSAVSFTSTLKWLSNSFMGLFRKRRERVYFYDGLDDKAKVHAVVDENAISKPNGIGLSVDGKRLFIAESSRSGKAKLRWVDLGANHLPKSGLQSFELNENSADGLAVRHNGDVYIASGKRIEIVTPGSKNPRRFISCPDGYAPSNLSFVSDDCLIVTMNRFSWVWLLFGVSTGAVVRYQLKPV